MNQNQININVNNKSNNRNINELIDILNEKETKKKDHEMIIKNFLHFKHILNKVIDEADLFETRFDKKENEYNMKIIIS